MRVGRFALAAAAALSLLIPPILELTPAASGARPGPAADPRVRAVARDYQALVAPIFERKCADCHTNHPRYPWYHRLPLIRSLIDHDVASARADMDLSRGFPPIGKGSPTEYLGAIQDALEDHSMPPLRYRLMHPGTALTAPERARILAWIQRGELELGKPPP
jgi:hypothetical protein